MFCYAHHSVTDTTQYVPVDVSSSTAIAWMSYYTNHRDMHAPQYVDADVPSSYFYR
jgi:hypothetical protein